ncbi:flagellar hook-length control protein FliK [Methylobacterium iners]|uniref:flagellar hook-length control protein FliK n=1 Tax=Methylobacterium iners TaxID=418707 RepID=UPI001EE2370F|nr:flagellar hook-length control protein FliK [Methylobacterium iners]
MIRRSPEAATRTPAPRARTELRERFTLAPAEREAPRPTERRPEPRVEARAAERAIPERRSVDKMPPDRAAPETRRPDEPDRPRKTPAETSARDTGRRQGADRTEPAAKIADGPAEAAVQAKGAEQAELEAFETPETEEAETVEKEAAGASGSPAGPISAGFVVAPVSGRRGEAAGDGQQDGEAAASSGRHSGVGGAETAGAAAEIVTGAFEQVLAAHNADAGLETSPLSAPAGAGAAAPTASAAATVTAPATNPADGHHPVTPPVPLGAVPMTIGLRLLAGSSRFEIRLDPVDLGRIDVSLDIDKDRGTVTTHLVVERPETLALLQRDAGSLQQALSQAGLDPSEGINLSLRDDTGSGGQEFDRQKSGSQGRAPSGTDRSDALAAVEAAPLRTLRGLSGIDIRI